MISTERNRRLWQACGWKPYGNIWLPPIDNPEPVTFLPNPKQLSFTGYLLRDGLPKVREKLSHPNTEVAIRHENGQELCIIRFLDSLGYGGSYVGETPTLSEAMFKAFEKAMGLDKEEK